MGIEQVLQWGGPLWTPQTFALLVMAAVGLLVGALAPSRPKKEVQERLGAYAKPQTGDVALEEELAKPFAERVIWPMLRGILRFLGTLAPKRNMEKARKMLQIAGQPGGLTVLDFFGVRLLLAVVFFAGYGLFLGRFDPPMILLRNGLGLGMLGFLLPIYWLRGKVKKRQHDVRRALPDSLDMLTIGVEAGLAFESALLRVGEKWDNALTREFRRVVAEMRMGTARDEALQRMVERTEVEDLRTFIAVLIQSTQLGVSIAEVLHSQAAEMRVKRRQHAEELARQAGVKMVFPLVFLVLPAIFVVILGPSVPRMLQMFGGF